ncbi:MAG: sensor histidine kinase, partial [Nostoc sp.]
MVKKILRRLLLSYLIVLSLILGGFAIAVRIVFTHSLYKQQTQKLTALAQVGAANAEFDNGRIKIEDDFPQEKLFEN